MTTSTNSTDQELNPCQADHERRRKAWDGAALVERRGKIERRIEFRVGYDHRSFPEACGGGGHGCHGMELCFVLLGSRGAVQFKMNMPNWVPGNIGRIGEINAVQSVSVVPVVWPQLGDGSAWDLGYHSPVQQYEGQDPMSECHLLPQGYCYYDGSSLNAVPILAAFLSHGPEAVWQCLASYYEETFCYRVEDDAPCPAG